MLKSLSLEDFARLLIVELSSPEYIEEDVCVDMVYWHTWDGFDFDSYDDAYEYVINWLLSEKETVQ